MYIIISKSRKMGQTDIMADGALNVGYELDYTYQKNSPFRLGAVRGSKIHADVAKSAQNLSVEGYTVRTEVSYLNGKIVPYGTRGSARLDAAVYDKTGNLVHVFDIKTGRATLSPTQIQKIQTQTGTKVPITAIKVE